MLRTALLSLSLIVLGSVTIAQTNAPSPDYARLFDAIGMDESFDIVAAAGRRDAQDLEADMFDGLDPSGWRDVAAEIYNTDLLRAEFTAGFPESRMNEDELNAALAFWESDLGQRIVAAELTAWRAISDPEIEEAANEVYFLHLERNEPRLEILERFIEVNDFVELNLAGALNSNFSFYRGLSDGGAYGMDLPFDMMLAEVWGQEAEIRESVTLWLYSFQLMAYTDLSDADMEAYIAFSQSEAGQAYNAAIFTGFDMIYEVTSYRLGTAAGYFMSGEPL